MKGFHSEWQSALRGASANGKLQIHRRYETIYRTITRPIIYMCLILYIFFLGIDINNKTDIIKTMIYYR